MAYLPEIIFLIMSLGLEFTMDITISYVWIFVYAMSLMNVKPYSPAADASHPGSFQLEQSGGKTLREMQQVQRTEQPQAFV